MYDRQYDQQTLSFEASGGLLHSSLVIQDKETDSYWSPVRGISIAGALANTRLKELPIGIKTEWREWVEMYPNTRVLSVNGREQSPIDPYQSYFSSKTGFGGRVADDSRLATKEPIFGFVREGVSFAVPLQAVEGGATFQIASDHVFLFRPVDSHVLRSTVAYFSSSGTFRKSGGQWIHSSSSALFDPSRGIFVGETPSDLVRMQGFDTFWYTWIPHHPSTKILTQGTSNLDDSSQSPPI